MYIRTIISFTMLGDIYFFNSHSFILGSFLADVIRVDRDYPQMKQYCDHEKVNPIVQEIACKRVDRVTYPC